ncbi:LPS translocon maturation chaperone LptM [Ahniella affigens]|uniref:LPS translocon maturation chaperone LptM n=1 Tax=Ahniella affigens TaxID=2021234 RepID=UPI001474A3E9|nr:lipoprotein [Ahniella affigens]
MNQILMTKIRRQGRRLTSLLVLCLVLSACGQSGELRHPDAPAPENNPAATE